MSLFVNYGYKLSVPNDLNVDGFVFQASAIPRHQLVRRKLHKSPQLNCKRFFDPQLYLAGLDANESSGACAKLATYSWFGIDGLKEYDSKQQKQSEWKEELEKMIADIWKSSPPKASADLEFVSQVVADCINFQMQIGCTGLILPTPLIYDPGTNLSEELLWLDIGLDFVKKFNIDLPIYATIAISDVCLRYSDPTENSLLDLILDSVSAREAQGVYLVIEQSSEANEARQIVNTRVLRSALHLTHSFKKYAGLKVGVNFFGVFGLVLEAVGADFWATGWYKSLYRLRIADKISRGRAFPLFWSQSAILDIHLEQDFDKISDSELFERVATKTPASQHLVDAAKYIRVREIPAWEHSISNITAAQDHFFQAISQAEIDQSRFSDVERLDFVENMWLKPATNMESQISAILGPNKKTRTEHVQAWYDAFRLFRQDHAV